MGFHFADDYRARLLALPTLLRRGGGAPEGAAGALKGGRIEFKDHRPYVQGDDPRDIDWNSWLRLDALVTKEYSRDEAPEVMVILDRSASMGITGEGKDRIAREIAGGLLYAGLSARCPVTAVLSAEGGPVTLGTWRTHRKVDEIIAMLEGLGECDGSTHLTGLRHLKPVAATGRVAFLVSDFLVESLPAEVAVALARGAGTGCFVHVVSEAERAPSLPAACTLVDPESSARMFVPQSSALVAAYAEELASHEEAVAALARRHGLGAAVVTDAKPFDRTVQALLAGKRSR
ncbi:MAG: hypothetical protein CMJ83_03430 [Planctomycetes bacterium]|nr:hypothetical protein [Planctomycetota bacterium]